MVMNEKKEILKDKQLGFSKEKKSGPMVRVRQYRSGIRCPKNQKKILEALGLGKINKCRTLPSNPCIHGMVEKIHHLVKIVEKL